MATSERLVERLEEIEGELTHIANGADYPQGCATRALMSLVEVRAALSAAEARLADARRAGFLDGLAAARCHDMHVDLIDAHPNTAALHERLAAIYMRGDGAALTEGERDG